MVDQKEVEAAEKRVAAMDFMDFIDGYRDRNLRTIVYAIEAGLSSEGKQRNECLYEALVMLRDVVKTGH